MGKEGISVVGNTDSLYGSRDWDANEAACVFGLDDGTSVGASVGIASMNTIVAASRSSNYKS